MRVIHPAPNAAVVECGKLQDRLQQLAVGYARRFDFAAAALGEQVAVQRGYSERPRRALVPKSAEGLDKPFPQVGVAVGGDISLGALAQARNAVVARIHRPQVGVVRRRRQPALFGDHQKQHPIDEGQQLAVNRPRAQPSGADVLPQSVASPVGEQRAAQNLQRALHAVAQLLADAPAFLDALLVVIFQQAAVRALGVLREAAGVHQPIHQRELAIRAAVHHRAELELQIGGLGHAGAVPEQPDGFAVAHHAPQRLRAVEEVLRERVRRAPFRAALVELAVYADNVDGNGALRVPDAVGYVERRAAYLRRRPLILQAGEAENLEKPLRHRLPRYPRSAVGRALEAVAEILPRRLGLGERRLRAVLQARAFGQPERRRRLAGRGRVARRDSVEQIGRKQTALHVYGRVSHVSPPPTGSARKRR